MSVTQTAMAGIRSVEARLEIVPTLTMAINGDLEFGTIAPPGSGTSTVSVLLSADQTSTCGVGLNCLAPGNRAEIQVGGAAKARFELSDPGSITLSDGLGNTMLVDNFIFGEGGNGNAYGRVFRLSNAGAQTLYVGATLHIPSGQPAGFYSGTYTVSANYE